MNKQSELDLIAESYNLYGSKYSRERISSGLLFNDFIEAPIIKKLLEFPMRISNLKVLDIGCGPGIYTKHLLNAGAKVVAIDSSDVMLEAAKEHCMSLPSELFSKCDFIKSTFEAHELNDSKFEIVMATFMLSYFTDLTQAFTKMRKHLGNDGIIITSMLHPIRLFAKNKNSHGYTVGDYFQSGNYVSDFLDSAITIPLRRYNFEQLHTAANQADLKIIQIIEPKADLTCDYPDREKLEFYSVNPSILIMLMGAK
ncbi:MAG: class I SAM-dependent methyltransferase [Desulfuromonadaceae bacterium]|nr:class I SAM-dependent methyltransferase [Desulfuromonadaceae bacterium]MDD2849440.1 class I SAM-dependent methyltransferase [Desulfuromonadaceae bacterium]MDD4130546.1 class I SAM-dependent methyltransferase [Desulfuromonadaceae bacterium]